VPTFEFCRADVLETGRMPIRVDLSQISLFDVAAYQVLIRFGDRCERRHLVNEWVNPSGSVELMFRILGPPLGELVDGASESDFHRCRRLAVTRFTTMLRHRPGQPPSCEVHTAGRWTPPERTTALTPAPAKGSLNTNFTPWALPNARRESTTKERHTVPTAFSVGVTRWTWVDRCRRPRFRRWSSWCSG
jgi:hypothetical protein